MIDTIADFSFLTEYEKQAILYENANSVFWSHP